MLQHTIAHRKMSPGRRSPRPAPRFNYTWADRGPSVDDILRALLTLAHPDKWAQGQPATALAHELTLAINALRQQKGGQR